MGVTGSSANSTLSASLPELCARVRKFAGLTPIAVGFGVNTREHFLSVGNMADGVVIGSKIVSVIKESAPDRVVDAIRDYCLEVSRPRRPEENGGAHEINLQESIDLAKVDLVANPTAKITTQSSEIDGDDEPNLLNGSEVYQVSLNVLLSEFQKLPARFGDFGGQYVPESLFDCLVELERAFVSAINDTAFWEEFRSYYPYMNRPSNLQFADRLTSHCGGARIWLKREDLNHTG
jgi:tryptophan synthase